MTMRVAILFDNFGPYHVARLAGAAEAGLDVLGVEARPKSNVYDWAAPEIPKGLRHACLGIKKGSSTGAIVAALEQVVAPFVPDAIALSGWATSEALVALDWARLRALPAVIMSETNAHDVGRGVAAEWLKRSIVRQYSAGLTGGDSGKAYLVSLGMAEDAVFVGYDAVDNAYFETKAADVRANDAMPEIGAAKVLEARHRGRYFLASARFIEKKNLARLIEAYSLYRSRSPAPDATWPLVILGDGVLRAELEARRAALGLDCMVHMPGFRQYGALPHYYGTAGAFVHASTTEQWGLVVNEAMASGLPVAVSRRCGCAEMLVVEGENGYTFNPHDIEAIAAVLTHIASHHNLSALGEASRRRIAEWGPERFGFGMAQAVEAARRIQRPSDGLLPTMVLQTVAIIQARRS